MAQDTTINSFEGGLNKDTALVSLPSNQYDEANDVEFISDESGKLSTLEAKKGTGLAKISVPNATPQNQIWRVRSYMDFFQSTVNGGNNYVVYEIFNFKDADGLDILSITINPAAPPPSPTQNTFKTLFEAAYAASGSGTCNVSVPPLFRDQYSTVEFTDGTQYASVQQLIRFYSPSGYYDIEDKLLLIQDRIITSTQLEPLAYVNSQNLGFILSVSDDNTITELGVANEDNNWAYTRLLRTKDFVLSKTEPIKMIVEQQNDGVYALYFTDNTIKDKCIYVPPTLTQDCCLTYSPSNIQVAGKGIYNLVQTNAQTNSQLVNNIGFVTYKNTLQSGGGLKTGGKRYVCRFGINGSNITTLWSKLSNLVPVIAESADSPLSWVNTQGTPNGEPTSKRNVITINNAQADVFNFVELAVVNYAGENAISAEIIGRFDVRGESFDIIHSGLEQTIFLDTVSLIEAEPTILKVKDIETKKNRINRANVVTANEDAKWLAIAESASLSTERFEIESTGKLSDTNGNLRFNALTTADIVSRQNPEKQLITFTPIATTPPIVSPSPYSSGIYTVQPSDGNNLFLNAVVNGRIDNPNTKQHTFYNMYIVILKNDIEVTSLLVADRNTGQIRSTDFGVDFTIKYTGTTSFNVATGDQIKFCVQLHCSDTGYIKFVATATNGIGINMWQANTQTSLQFAGTQLGEYQIPFNVANKTGYMLYEYYLMYVRFHLKNGYITAPYPIGKYTLPDLTQIRGLTQITPSNPNTPFSDTSITNGRKVYNYAVKVNGLDITNVKNEVIGVSFERSEPLNTVIGSGIYHNARKFEGDIYTSGLYNLSGSPLSATSDLRKFGIFISNDLVNQSIKYSNGDYLKLLGIPLTLSYNDNFKSGTNKRGVTNEYLGSVSTIAEDVMTSTNYTIVDSSSIGFNEQGNILSNTSSNLFYKPSTSQTNNAYYNGLGVAISTSAFVRTVSPTSPSCTEKNTYVAFYIRPIDLSAVDYKNYKPIPTGEIIRIDATTNPLISQVVYGGDTYTQKVLRKSAFWYQENNTDDTAVSSLVVGFYAQNRLNSQLFYNDNTAPIDTWNLQGSKSLYQYLFPFSDSSEIVDEQHNFDKSYIGANQVNRIAPYNPLLPYPTSNPTRIYYSDEKAVGSLYDAYRKVRPLNFVDLELQNGAISAIYDIRDVMVVIQPTFVGAIPYAADTLIQTDNTAKILVGSGTVYSNRIYPLSSFGTSIKTMSCKGYNSNGNPQVYWMSDDFSNFNRYDYSGVKILSSDNNMRTWFLNNTGNIKKEFDVNIYYNTKKEDVVITARAVRNLPAWNPATTYAPNTYVTYGAAGGWKNFEEIPSVYASINSNTNSNPFDNPNNWAVIPSSDNTFYNMWSLIFNEKRNNFTTFMTPLQKRYFKHNNLVLTPRGVVTKGLIYQMDNINGDSLQWFPLSLGSTQYKQGEFILSTVFNKFGLDKKMINVNFERGDDAAVQPTTVTAITPTQSIVLPINETRLGVTYYPSYYDEFGDTPYGQFIKILIKKQTYLKIRTIAMKFKNKFPLRMK